MSPWKRQTPEEIEEMRKYRRKKEREKNLQALPWINEGLKYKLPREPNSRTYRPG